MSTTTQQPKPVAPKAATTPTQQPKPVAPKAATTPTQQPKPAAPKAVAPAVLYVKDLNCAPSGPHREREHVILMSDGAEKPIKFEYGVARKLDAGAARRFLHIPEFGIYEDADCTKRVHPTPKNKSGSDGKIALEPGEVIAQLEELSNDALLSRCAQYAGSEEFDAESEREDLILFLKAELEASGAVSNETKGDEMSDDELDNLLN